MALYKCVYYYYYYYYYNITSSAGAVAKYCDEYVCVSVCLTVPEHISGATRAIFSNFLCTLPMAVARSSSGRVTKSHKEGAILGVFIPNDNAL